MTPGLRHEVKDAAEGRQNFPELFPQTACLPLESADLVLRLLGAGPGLQSDGCRNESDLFEVKHSPSFSSLSVTRIVNHLHAFVSSSDQLSLRSCRFLLVLYLTLFSPPLTSLNLILVLLPLSHSVQYCSLIPFSCLRTFSSCFTMAVFYYFQCLPTVLCRSCSCVSCSIHSGCLFGPS